MVEQLLEGFIHPLRQLVQGAHQLVAMTTGTM